MESFQFDTGNAAGRPIIASSGVPEAAVEHGANGLRYQYGNIEELENAIVSILRDDELYEELARGSRTWACARTVDATGSEFRAMLAVAIEAAGRGLAGCGYAVGIRSREGGGIADETGTRGEASDRGCVTDGYRQLCRDGRKRQWSCWSQFAPIFESDTRSQWRVG